MSSYAQIENGVVVNTIEATPEFISQIEGDYVEAFPDANGEPEKRFNYPQVGDTYDSQSDAFYTPTAPYVSWVMSSTYQWQAPIPKPEGNAPYVWNEPTLSWQEVT